MDVYIGLNPAPFVFAEPMRWGRRCMAWNKKRVYPEYYNGQELTCTLIADSVKNWPGA